MKCPQCKTETRLISSGICFRCNWWQKVMGRKPPRRRRRPAPLPLSPRMKRNPRKPGPKRRPEAVLCSALCDTDGHPCSRPEARPGSGLCWQHTHPEER